MITRLFSYFRLLIVLLILYIFCYEYLYKKYSVIMVDFDQFNWRDRFGHGNSFRQKFNFTQKPITGTQFGSTLQKQNHKVHIGQFNNFKNQELQNYNKQISTFIPNSFQDLLSKTISTKKVDSYQFNFYNWYKFQLTFTDIGHDSYFEFRLSEKKKGSHQIVEEIGFKLPERFYSQDKNDNQNKFKVDFKAKGIQLKVEQFFVDERYYDSQSDGLQNQPFFNLTQNKTELTQQEYIKFGSKKTLTKFNFTFIRKDYEIKAHVSHVIRHNQCLTSYQNDVLRHKCMGGYGKGKISFSQFLRQSINTKQNQYSGNWQRNSYNLDNTRVRTVFIGERYLKNNIIQKYVPKLYFNSGLMVEYPLVSNSRKWIEIDFIGFNKPQYYTKRDRIQKQRWVGMTLYKPLEENGQVQAQSLHESYFFINGNIHPIYKINFSFPLSEEHLRNGRIIRFNNKAESNSASELTPSFEIQLQIQNSTLVQESGVLNNKQIYRVDGYWKGQIDEGSLFDNLTLRQHYNSTYEYGYVEFYEIQGTIKITEQAY